MHVLLIVKRFFFIKKMPSSTSLRYFKSVKLAWYVVSGEWSLTLYSRSSNYVGIHVIDDHMLFLWADKEFVSLGSPMWTSTRGASGTKVGGWCPSVCFPGKLLKCSSHIKWLPAFQKMLETVFLSQNFLYSRRQR